MSTEGFRGERRPRERHGAGRRCGVPSRREWLWRWGGGLGGLALATVLGRRAAAGDATSTRADGGLHHAPRARRVIQLFMNGGASPMDTFDHKPTLARRHGMRFDPGEGERVESVTGSPGFKVLSSPFEFRRHGECGRWVSSVFPQVATHVDRMAFLMSMSSTTNVHGPASYLGSTGFARPGFPCAGAWVSYALGCETEDLPTFVVIPDARGLPYNNQGNFSSAFLPARHAGTVIDASSEDPIRNLRPPAGAEFISERGELRTLEVLARLNELHRLERPGDTRLEARIASYELAARMQLSAPEAFDLARETESTRRLYGLDRGETAGFGRSCLLARRLVERGVRFVQLWSGAGGAADNWDNHGDIRKELAAAAGSVDRPIAGLLTDLAQRGLLEDTLVVWTTEFGRMPFSQNQGGRDHNAGTYVSWLAGAGVRGGTAWGESDEWGWKSLVPTPVHDLHATMLWLLGIDHERLTFRHDGIDRRLTDVHGEVLGELLA